MIDRRGCDLLRQWKFVNNMRTKKPGYWRNLFLYTAFLLILAVLGVLLSISYKGAMNYLHPSRTHRPATENPARHGITYQDITLVTSDGLKLEAWYSPSQNGAVILVAHGFGGARSADLHAAIAQYGYGVVSWDARAHGESEGELCTWGYYETRDVEAALTFALNQKGVRHVGALGQSMGAVTILRSAAPGDEIEAIVIDSAFPTIEEMVERVISSPIMRPCLRFFVEREIGLIAEDLRPIDEIGRISPRPIFILQGGQDTVIPPDSAQRLYDAAGEPRHLWVVERVGHAAMFDRMRDEYMRRVIGFFDETFDFRGFEGTKSY
jgi:fermentation-respiration switch protein FrsA (DUF1100 family)